MLNNENGGVGMNMDVVPAYNGGNNGWGGDGSWWLLILFLFAFGGNGWGGGFGNMDGGLYPWLNNSQNINGGFRDQLMNTNVQGIQNAVTAGFGDVQTALCGGFAGVNANIANGFAQAEIGENARQMASMQQMFDLQSQMAQCCCDNRLATCQTQNIVQTEAAATRASASADTQRIMDKLCQLELDGVKSDLAQAQRENIALQNAVNMASMRESQTAQTAQILAGQAAEIDGVYNRLKSCPVPSMPVYGNVPIFQCQGQNPGCGCGV